MATSLSNGCANRRSALNCLVRVRSCSPPLVCLALTQRAGSWARRRMLSHATRIRCAAEVDSSGPNSAVFMWELRFRRAPPRQPLSASRRRRRVPETIGMVSLLASVEPTSALYGERSGGYAGSAGTSIERTPN